MNRRIFLMILSLALLLVSTQSFAQWVPPRSYWKPYNGAQNERSCHQRQSSWSSFAFNRF